MKKLIIAFIMALVCVNLVAEPVVVRNGNRFKIESSRSVSTSTENTESILTDYEYEIDGQIYPIFMASNGAYFIVKVSRRTERVIRYYLPWVIREQLDEEMGISNPGFSNSKIASICKK